MTARRVALLATGFTDIVLEHVLAVAGDGFGAHPDAGPAAAGLPPVAEGEAVVVTSDWARKAAAAGRDVVGDVIPRLRERFDRVVGWDQEVAFVLDFAPDVMAALDAVLRPHGVYRDRGLYDYQVGALTAGGRWTERTVPLPARYQPASLARLVLAPPGFVTECPPVRVRMRAHRGAGGLGRVARGAMDAALGFAPALLSRLPPPRTAQFLGALTHVQRRDALRRLRRSRLRCHAGLTHVWDLVAGLEGDGPRVRLDPERKAALTDELRREGLLVPRISRPRYRLDMLASKAVVSIVGHGEICFRMAEAMGMGRLLVAQDLSHVDMQFPFRDRENVVYCRPDLADLVDILDDVECNYGRYRPIAERGHADFLAYSARAVGLLADAAELARGGRGR
jgi:hypothetical protein